MNALRHAAMRLLDHKLLWAKETVLLVLAAAHIPAWFWLPLSTTGWLVMHAVLPVTMMGLLWFAWRIARVELGPQKPVSPIAIAAAALGSALIVWGLLSLVPMFSSIEMQTASFVLRGLLAAFIATGLILLPFAYEGEHGNE